MTMWMGAYGMGSLGLWGGWGSVAGLVFSVFMLPCGALLFGDDGMLANDVNLLWDLWCGMDNDGLAMDG